MSRNFRIRALGSGLLMLMVAACGGSQIGTLPAGPPLIPISTPTPRGGGTASATLTITIPRAGASDSISRHAARFRPDYISINTQSMSIIINGGAPQDFGLTNTSPGCSGTGSSTQCTIVVAAPVGNNETWAFALYSTTNETGTPLSLDTQTGVNIVAGSANILGPYTLNPVVGSYAVAWNSHSFTSNASSTGSFYLTVKDPSGATIIAPGTYETAGGATVTFSLSDNLPNAAPFNNTAWSYALSFASGSSTQPASSVPSNQINVAYGGLSVPATSFYVNDNQGIQAANATSVSQSAVLGSPTLTAACQEATDACTNGTTSTAASVSLVYGGDTATLTPSEPGWTDSPYNQSFSISTNTCTGGTAGTTESGLTPTWTLTANTGNNPGSCSVSLTDSATLNQTVTANVTYTYSVIIIQVTHKP